MKVNKATEKSINVSVSDDGDPWELGDLVAFEAWDGIGVTGYDAPPTTGSAYMGTIEAINGQNATIAYVDTFFNPTGMTCVRPLTALREYNLPGAPDTQEDIDRLGDDEPPDAADVADVFAGKADKNPDDFAYVPDKNTPSGWKLDISDFDHACLAAQAIVSGFRGKKVDIPGKALAKVKSKIKFALNKWATADDKDRKQKWLDALDGKKASKSVKTAYDTIDLSDDEPSTAIKSIGDDRFGGYAVLWGDKSRKDFDGDWFTPQTDLALEAHATPDLPTVVIPTLYHHALDKLMGVKHIGTIDTTRADDIGQWVEGQYNKRHKYKAHVKKMVDDGILSFSTGSIPHHVERKSKGPGEITRWPIYEISMTPTPAEMRGTDVHTLKSLKHYGSERAIAQAYKALKLPVDKFGLSLEADTESAQESAVSDVAIKLSSVSANTSNQEVEMDPKEIAAIVGQVLDARETAAKTAEQQEAERQAAIKAEVDKQVAEALKAAKIHQGKEHAKPLPAEGTQAAAVKTDARSVIEVGEDRKYADVSGVDMSFLVNIYAGMYRAVKTRQGANIFGASELSKGEQEAVAFIENMAKDPDRKMQRMISAKTIRQYNRKEVTEQALDFLPYKSLDDVYGNDYDEKAAKAAIDEIKAAIKSNELDNTAQSGFGIEWVPTVWSQDWWRRVRIANNVASNMQVVQMPSNPFNLPFESTDPTVYAVGEATDLASLVFTSANTITASKVATGKNVLTAKKQGVRIGVSAEEVEDSIIPVLTGFRAQAERSLQNAIDDTLLNGDTVTTASTNINLIDGTPTAGTSYLSFDGLLKNAIITNTAQAIDFAGAPTLKLFRKLRKSLNKPYSVDLPNLVYIVGVETYFAMLDMPEFKTYINVGAPGSAATGLLPGGSVEQVGMQGAPVGYIDGVAVYVSAQLALGDTAGKIPTAGGTLGRIVLFHKTRWYLGYRRQIQLDVFTPGMAPLSDTYQLWGTVRYGLIGFDTSSVAVGYDITV